MKLCEFKYIFTIIGGGWVSEHELYAVTKDGKIYNTNKFDKLCLSTDLDLTFKGIIPNVSCVLKDIKPHIVMDAPYLELYEVKNENIEKIYEGWFHSPDNPDFISDVRYIVQNSRNHFQLDGKEHLVIGELNNEFLFKNLLATNNKVLFTIHAKGDKL